MKNLSLGVKYLLGGIVIFVLGFGVWGFSQWKESVHKRSRVVSEQACSKCPFVFKGISCYFVQERRKVYFFKADEFKINPRAYGVFLIQPIKEATLTNAFIEVYLSAQDDSMQEVDLFPSSLATSAISAADTEEQKKLLVRRIGFVTRLMVQKVRFSIYKDEELTITFTADQALTDLKNGETVLRGFQIEHKASRKIISARTAIWDAKENVFKIPSEYIAVTPKGKAKGYGIKVNLDFKVIKI